MKVPIALIPVLLVSLLPLPSLHAATANWTGLGDGLSWEDATNWLPGLPEDSDTAAISAATSVTLSSPASIAELQLGRPIPAGTSTLTVTSGGILLAFDSTFANFSSSRIGGTRGGATLRLERGSDVNFSQGLIFGGPWNGPTTLDYFGSGTSFTDFLSVKTSGIAADSDNNGTEASAIEWNFHIDRDESFFPISCTPLRLSTTASANPNSIRLDIIQEGTPFQAGDTFQLVSHASNYTGTFLAPDGSAAIPDGGTFTKGDTTFRIDYDVSGVITATVVDDCDSPLQLAITGVIDGPLDGGTPKAVELYVLEDIPDLSVFSLTTANNGGPPNTSTLPLSGSAALGDYIYVSVEQEGFADFFGFSPTITGMRTFNGNDAIILNLGDDIHDVFGVVGENGTGTAWEYTDGWAYRMSGACPTGSFEIDEWHFSGAGALEGSFTNRFAWNAVPLGTFSTTASFGTDLGSLTTSHGWLLPHFNPAITRYWISVEHNVEEITLTPIEAATGATIAMSQHGLPLPLGDPIELDRGSNVIEIIVTAPDGVAWKSYEVTVYQSNRTASWDGGGDGESWEDPENWSDDLLPGSEDDVSIYTGGEVTLTGFEYTEISSLQLFSGELVMGEDSSFSASSWSYIGGAGGEPSILTLGHGYSSSYYFTGVYFGGWSGGDAILNDYGSGASFGTLAIDPDTDDESFEPSLIEWNFFIDRDGDHRSIDAGIVELETIGSSVPNAVRLNIEPSGDPFQIGDSFTLIQYWGGAVSGRFLSPDGDPIEDDETFESEDYTYEIDYDDGESISVTVVGIPDEYPVITTDPTAYQAIALGATTTLSVTASGDPSPSFQWYRGKSGETHSPIAGATSSTYTTPPTDGSTEFWVRASNIHGTADSETAVVVIISSDADLNNLVPNVGSLSPTFSPATTEYVMTFSHEREGFQIYALASDSYATMQINGDPVPWGSWSAVLPLAVGSNLITVEVLATDGTTSKTYEITVTRAEQLVVWDAGGDGSSWFDAANWSFDLVPLWSDDVSISTVGSVTTPTNSLAQCRSLDLRGGELTVGSRAYFQSQGPSRIGGLGEGPATLTVGEYPGAFVSSTFPALTFGGPAGGEVVFNLHGAGVRLDNSGIDPMADNEVLVPSPIRWNYRIDTTQEFYPVESTALALETVGSATPNAIRLDIIATADPFELNDKFTLVNYAGGSVTGRFLTPDGLAVIGDDTSFESGGFTFRIDYDDGDTITATVVDIPSGTPVITAQPVAEQTIEHGTTVTLTVEATSDPAPTYQWYLGDSGNESFPVAGATLASFTPPPLTATTSSFWVRVSGSTGSINSDTAVVHAVQFANADLSSLTMTHVSLQPPFNPALTDYSAAVDNTVVEVWVRPITAELRATVEVNGTVVERGHWSTPINVAVGANPIEILVRAFDGVVTKTYTLTVNRLAPTLVTTGPATEIGNTSATVAGTVTPNGNVTVWFEYGTGTGYGATSARQYLSGTDPVEIAAPLAGLDGGTPYHYRLVAHAFGGSYHGEDASFTTLPSPPVAATGNAVAITDTSATLIGAVNPHELATEVYFEYGLTELFGNTTPVEIIPAGSGLVDVLAPVGGLLTDGTYHYRLVARNPAGTDEAAATTFVATAGTSTGTGIPTASPTVTTDDAWDVAADTAMLRGTVNGHGGTTVVWFEYGTDTAYGQMTAEQGIGNSDAAATLSLSAEGLLPDTEYHYRTVGSNSLGITNGLDRVFRTEKASPLVTTGETELLTTTSVRVEGTVRASDTNAAVWIDYGTSPSLLTNSVRATPATVSGNELTPVQANLTDLIQTVRYYYQVRAEDSAHPDRVGLGAIRNFSLAALSGLAQEYPEVVPLGDREGEVSVSFTPAGVAGGWRFRGERSWKVSGESATGLASGDRTIEFRPVPGYLQPEPETVAVISGNPPQALERAYTPSATPGSGELIVNLKPDALADGSNPVESRAQWRLLGESDAHWRDGGSSLTELVAGDYIIACKPIAGRTTPALVTARVQDGLPTLATATYFLATPPGGTPPAPLSFPQISATSVVPYPFAGQIRSDVGSSTGFVVRPGVVATAGHVVFDDGTLAATTGMQWLFQRHRGVHEPTAQPPRGFYLLSGYAEQRALEDTPGESSPESQNLDAAALYFLEDPGRGGFSGFLASDSDENEFLLSPAKKTLVGYPIDGVGAADLNRMHATPLTNVTFAPAFGQTYTSADISATGGNSGGPLCVLHSLGRYYPAAIYLGGTGQMVVRVIDSDVLALFGCAEASSIPGGDHTGGSASLATSAIGTPTLGALEVFIEPAEARANGAGWRINSQSNYEASGTRMDDLVPRSDYGLQFATVPGFLPPTSQLLEINGGELLSVTFTYEILIPAPVITSGGLATNTRGEGLNYQITASNSPESFSLAGALPAGVSFNAATGLISGTLGEAGRFDVTIGASNAGGADNKTLSIISTPVLDDQEFTAPEMVSMGYAIVSGESGTGVSFGAAGLPDGLSLDPASGLISGTPESAGVYPVTISVNRRDASASATLTLNITGDAPAITLDLPASRAVEYGLSTLLTVAADGTPAPGFQWFEGPSGDDSNPVAGATGPTFTTPPVTAPVSYWARAVSISGSADSSTTNITVLPSVNARLSNLIVSGRFFSPAFNPTIFDYEMVVPDDIDQVVLIPFAQIDRSLIEINGSVVTTGSPSDPVPLAPGLNTITVDVTADDGIASELYTVTITRSDPPVVTTGVASAIDDISAMLHGTVTPNGPATAYFEYGPTTAYGKATPSQAVIGDTPVEVESLLTALSPETDYHYRLVLTTSGGTTFEGADRMFTTGPPRPVAATSPPVGVTTAQATLVGAVIPIGQDTTVYFEYGSTTTYDNRTPDQLIPAGTSVRDVVETITGLTPSAFYHYRIVATNAAGSAHGDDIEFQAVVGTGAGDGIPDAPPTVTTLPVGDVTPTSAQLSGSVNPNDGTTLAYFEYGPTTDYGFVTPSRGKGNGSVPTGVSDLVEGLVSGALYHYRLVASNSLGESVGNDVTFRANSPPPRVTTGAASALTATSARVTGTVNAQNAATEIFVDYGTDPDGIEFPFSTLAGSAHDNSERIVSTDLINLEEGITYYYRLRAVSSGGTSTGETRPLSTWILLGFQQQFSRELPPVERDGRLMVHLDPAGTGAWHFAGETIWRPAGEVVTGLLTGERQIEFQAVPGSIQPLPEIVSIVSGGPVTEYHGTYYHGSSGSGAIRVVLFPETVSDPGVPVADRAQWRLRGHADPTWRDSGDEWSGLQPGSYLVECKPIAGLDAPPAGAIIVEDGATSALTRTYLPASPPTLFPPEMLPIETTSTSEELPYAYVGQIRSATGSFSGFVVKPRVVATVAQAIYDETTLEATPGLQWILQRDHGSYEPEPQIPRGFYSIDDYASQRAADDTPGEISLQAQNSNVAALYFSHEAGRGGFAGYLASDAPGNEFLESDEPKILVGYPVHGVAPQNQGRMHTTHPRTTALTQEFERVFTTSAIQGGGGFIGGPLCVQHEGGAYYPAAIHVGGGAQSRVRAIDTPILDLFFRAAISANGGDNNTSGGISHTSFIGYGAPADPGKLKILIEPAGALAMLPGWEVLPEPGLLTSGTTIFGLPPGTYSIRFRTIPGFGEPTVQTYSVLGGSLTEVVFTYPPEASELDSWRLTHFGAPLPPEAADDADPDRDGVTNYHEFIALTDPNDPGDFFRVGTTERTGTTFNASVLARAGRRYELQRSTTEAGGPWLTVDSTARSVSDGDAAITLSDTNPAPSGLYRVAVSVLVP